MEIKILNNLEIIHPKEKVISYIKNNSRIDYDENTFLWQYKSNLSVFGVIQKDDSIFGTQGMIATDLLQDDNLLLTHKSETTFLSEAIRGKGLFEKLYFSCVNNCKERGSHFIWGFTALSKVWRKKLGFYVDENLICESEIIISYKHQRNIFFRGPKNLKGFSKTVFYFFKALIFKFDFLLDNKINPKEIKTIPSKNIEHDIATLILKINQYKQFYTLNYSDSFIKTRIYGSPLNKYNSLVIYKNNDPLALVIYTTNNCVFRISECLYSDEDSLKQLFINVIKLAITLKQSKIAFWGNFSNPIYNKIFKLMTKYGSKTLPCKDMNFVLLNCYETNFEYKNLENWLINGLWTEGYSY